MQFEVVLVSTYDGFKEIRDPWLRLCAEHKLNFASYPIWHEAGFAALGFPKRLVFVCVYSRHKLIAVVPIQQCTLSKGPINLKFLEIYSPYSSRMGYRDLAMIVPFPAIWPDIIISLKRHFRYHYIRLQYLADSSVAVTSGVLLIDGYQKVSHQSSYLSVTQGYDAFISQYKSKFQREVRRRRRNAQAMGDYRLESFTEYADLKPAFDVFLDVEASGWKGEANTSIKQEPDVLRFFQSLLEEYGRLGRCHIFLLYINDTCIAAQFGLLSGNTNYMKKIAYNQEYSSISPGQLLIDEMARFSERSDLFKNIHFITGVNWLKFWKPAQENMHIVYTPGGRLIGRLFCFMLRVRAAVAVIKNKYR